MIVCWQEQLTVSQDQGEAQGRQPGIKAQTPNKKRPKGTPKGGTLESRKKTTQGCCLRYKKLSSVCASHR